MPQLATALAEKQADDAAAEAAAAAAAAAAEEEEDGGDGGEIDESFGDYASIEDMQAHHERQIIQLTEMHCDVMEMNDHLQVGLVCFRCVPHQPKKLRFPQGCSSCRMRRSSLTPPPPRPTRHFTSVSP